MSNIPSKSGYYWMRRVDVSLEWEPVRLWRNDDGSIIIITFDSTPDFVSYGSMVMPSDEGRCYAAERMKGYEQFAEWSFLSPPPEREDDGLDDAAGDEVMSDQDMMRDEQEHPKP